MLGLTKTRRQADMRKSGPSGKRRARFFAAHRYRKSGPRKTALTGLRKKKNDCRYIDDTGACITPEARGGGLPPFKGIGRRSWKGHGESKEEARKRQGKSTEKTRREQGESKGEQGRARESKERAKRKHGESKEGAQRGHGKATKDRERVKRRPGAPQKSRLEGERTGWKGGGKNRLEGGGKEPAGRGGEVPIEVHEHKKTGALIGRRYVAR